MALVLTDLQTDMSKLGLQVSGAAAAEAFAQAYNSYAISAQDPGGNPLLTAFAPAFTAQLAKAFASFNGTAQTAATAFAAAFTAFWSGATFAASPGLPAPGPCIGGSGTMAFSNSSAVVLADPAGLQQDLLALFSTTDASTADRLAALASSLHKATTTGVLVLMTGLDVTPPPTGPLPTKYQGYLI